MALTGSTGLSMLRPRLLGAAAALPDYLWRVIVPKRPIIDGQRMNPRLHLFANLGKHDLLAESPPTAFKRRRMDLLMSLLAPVAERGTRVRDVEFAGAVDSLTARLYEPAGVAHSAGLLVYVHGGGWHVGSAAGYDPLARFLAEHAAVKVLSVNYRLAPEHPFPASFEDAMAGYRYAVDRAADFGVGADRIGIAGDSAGGNLAAAIALRLGTDDVYRPAVAVLIYPAVDRDLAAYESSRLFQVPLDQGCVERAMDWYAPNAADRTDPRFCVMAADNLMAMPPTYLATAGMDVLRDQGEAFGRRLGEAGVDVEVRRFRNMPHGFASMLVDPEARAATMRIAEYIRGRLG
jgi:acetyl esterase